MAITQYYVDPAIAGNSGTGTIGDPYGDLQYALDQITRDSTNGDQINVKAGTSEVLTASLSLATYGTPTGAAPLVLRGYTSAADDSGIGVIDGGGNFAIWSGSSNDYIHMVDLRLTNSGANWNVAFRNYCSLTNCEIDTGSSGGLLLIGPSTVLRCYVHGFTGSHGIYATQASRVVFTLVTGCGANTTHYQIALEGPNMQAICNICIAGTKGGMQIKDAISSFVFGNTIYGANSTGYGLNVDTTHVAQIANNIVEGFKVGINLTSSVRAPLYHSNAAYNNTTNFSNAAGWIGSTANNDALAASPFVDASSSDFDINGTQVGVTEDAWSSTFHSLAATTPKADKGAVQAGAGIGGGMLQANKRGNKL